MSAEAANATISDTLKEFTGSLKSSLSPLKDMAKLVGGTKFGKNIKEFGKSMKSMAAASIQSWKMEQVMKLIEPFLMLLQLFEPIISILSGLLSVLVFEIFKEFIPFTIQFSQWLLGLMPIFKAIGSAIAKFIKGSIEFLIKAFIWLEKVIDPIWKFLTVKMAPAWKFLGGVLNTVWSVLKSVWTFLKVVFIPILNVLKGAWGVLVNVWNATGGKLFGKDGIITRALNALLNIGKAIVNGFISAINAVIGVINIIPGVNISKLPKLAKGGIVKGPQPVFLGDNTSGTEAIIPLERADEFGFGNNNEELLDEMKETNRYLRILASNKRGSENWQH